MRIGILGGTFDPIHHGHLFIAEDARARLGLERVLIMPNGTPPHKKPYAVSAATHRLRMVELAVHGSDALVADDTEVRMSGPSYTVQTLRSLHTSMPGTEFWFITGLDAVAEIGTWREPEEVVRLSHIVAVSRPGHSAAGFEAAVPASLRRHVELLRTPEIGISSTDIRARVAAGLPIRYLTPDAVVAYIRANALYRPA